MRSALQLRRTLALGALLLLVSAPARAGHLEAYGFRTGLSATRLSGDFGESIGGEYRNGFTAAAYWRIRLGRLLSFAPEVAWVARGGDGSIQVMTSGSSTQVYGLTLKNQLQYFEFPLLVRLDLPAARSIRPYLVGGPAPALKAGAKQVTETTVTTVPGATVPQLQYAYIVESAGTLGNQRVERIDLGLVGGAGATLGSGRTRLVFEGRYTHGLLDVMEGGTEARNGGFAAALGVEFR